MPVPFDSAALVGTGSCGCHQQIYGFVSADPEELLSPEGWTDNGTPGVTIGPDTITFDPSADGSTASQLLPEPLWNTNNPYYVSITVDSITQGSLFLYGKFITAPGTYVWPVSNAASEFVITTSLSDAVVSNISLKLLNDNQLGSELITNGDFSSGSGWVFTPDSGSTTPWIISAGAMHASENDGGYATNTGATMENEALYRLQFTISNLTTGILNIAIDEGGGSFNSFNDAAGSRDFDSDDAYIIYTVASANGELALYDSFGAFDLDNVSLKKYTLPS